MTQLVLVGARTCSYRDAGRTESYENYVSQTIAIKQEIKLTSLTEFVILFLPDVVLNILTDLD